MTLATVILYGPAPEAVEVVTLTSHVVRCADMVMLLDAPRNLTTRLFDTEGTYLQAYDEFDENEHVENDRNQYCRAAKGKLMLLSADAYEARFNEFPDAQGSSHVWRHLMPSILRRLRGSPPQ